MKRILAIITSLALLLSVVIIPSAFIVNAEETAPTYYVSATTGSDDNDGSAEAPLQTINAAQTLIAEGDTDTTGQDGTIIVIDTAEFDGGVAHTGMITIKGADSTATLTYKSKNIQFATEKVLKVVTLQGPTTFDNIVCPTSSASSNTYLVTAGHKAIFDLPGTGTAEKIFMVGQVTDTPEGTRENVVFDSIGGAYGAYNCVTIGAASYTNNVSAGVDLEINAGRLAKITLAKGTTYSGNVNIVFNNFNGRYNAASTAFENNTPIINGAFQVIVNNGRISQFSDAAVTNMNAVEAAGGTWIMRGEKASDGTVLDTTDTAGKFAVVGNLVANAYKVVDGVESETAIQSANGILDLSGVDKAGVYNVKYTTRSVVENSDSVVYVDAENGKDINDGKTPETAFGTFEFASDWLAASSAETKEIIVIGTSTYAVEDHEYLLTISGYDENSKLNVSGAIAGPTKFKDLILPSLSMQVNGNEVVYENISLTKYCADGKLIIGPSDTDTADDIHRAVFNGFGKEARMGMIRVGKVGGTVNGRIDAIVNSGYFWQFSFEKENVFNGNVNLAINGGSVYGDNAKYYFGGIENSTFNGALQIIFNGTNESKASSSIYDVTAAKGKWIIYGARTGKLSATDVGGIYTVTGAKYAKAVNASDGKIYYSKDGVLDLSDNAGEYNVSYFNSLKQGDANGDGDLDIRDLVAMKGVIADELPDDLIIDLDGSNKNDAGDLTVLTKHLLNIESIVWEDTLNYLSNTYSKLVNDKELNVLFMGGSVTDGYGSTNGKEKGWPKQICDWLADKYDANVIENRKSIGGTGSLYGAFRYSTEVTTVPDLFFIEFAINDRYEKYTYEESVKYSETLVRNALEMNPNMDIVYVLTFDRNYATEDFINLQAHRDVAEKYGFLCIKIADEFYEIMDTNGTNAINYIPDGVHPNDDGYALYGEIIKKGILAELPAKNTETSEIKEKVLCEPMSEYFENPNILAAKDIEMLDNDGWTFYTNGSQNIEKRFGGSIKNTKEGASFTFEFEGKDLGVTFLGNSDIGSISVSIDENEPIIVDGYSANYDEECLLIAENMNVGTHTVTVTSIDGTFKIAGFLVN